MTALVGPVIIQRWCDMLARASVASMSHPESTSAFPVGSEAAAAGDPVSRSACCVHRLSYWVDAHRWVPGNS